MSLLLKNGMTRNQPKPPETGHDHYEEAGLVSGRKGWFPLLSRGEGLVSARSGWEGLFSGGFVWEALVSGGFGSFRFLVHVHSLKKA